MADTDKKQVDKRWLGMIFRVHLRQGDTPYEANLIVGQCRIEFEKNDTLTNTQRREIYSRFNVKKK